MKENIMPIQNTKKWAKNNKNKNEQRTIQIKNKKSTKSNIRYRKHRKRQTKY